MPEQFSTEVVCDELELAWSIKGRKVLERNARKRGTDFKRNQESDKFTIVQVVTVVQRNGEKLLKEVASKQLSKQEIEKSLDDKLADNIRLITNKHPSYKAFAKDYVDKNDKTIYLQKVNNVHAQLRTFLRSFNDVSSKTAKKLPQLICICR